MMRHVVKLLVLLLPMGLFAKGPVSYYGQMQAVGNRIQGAKTQKAMQVKGASFFWSNMSQKFWTAAIVDRLVDEFQVEIVRCAFGIDDNGSPSVDSKIELLDSVVNQAIKRDIYVIIDWHSHHAEANVAAAQKFFSAMAQKYGKYDHVIFELYNEPLQIPWTVVKEYEEKVIPEIRKYSDNLIIAGTPTWSQNIDEAALNPIKDINIAYAFHFYVPNHGIAVADKLPIAMKNNAAVFASEWGFWDKSEWCQCNMEIADWMKLLDDNQVSWCMWAVNDKEEKPSIFAINQGPTGTLSETGIWFRKHLEEHAKTAPWRLEEVTLNK